MCWRYLPKKGGFVFRCTSCPAEITLSPVQDEAKLGKVELENSVLKRVQAMGWYITGYKPRSIVCPACAQGIKPPVQKRLSDMGKWEQIVESVVGDTYRLKVPGGFLYLHQYNYELANGSPGVAQTLTFGPEGVA